MTDRFSSGDRVALIGVNEIVKKKGKIRRLRDDRYERTNCWAYGKYHYSVDYDDGTFETYESGDNLKRITSFLN